MCIPFLVIGCSESKQETPTAKKVTTKIDKKRWKLYRDYFRFDVKFPEEKFEEFKESVKAFSESNNYSLIKPRVSINISEPSIHLYHRGDFSHLAPGILISPHRTNASIRLDEHGFESCDVLSEQIENFYEQVVVPLSIKLEFNPIINSKSIDPKKYIVINPVCQHNGNVKSVLKKIL